MPTRLRIWSDTGGELYDMAAISCWEIGDVGGGVGDWQRMRLVMLDSVEFPLSQTAALPGLAVP